MSIRKGPFEPEGLTIAYNILGTISIEELAHALVADIFILRDLHNIRFVRAKSLRISVTDEHGTELRVRRRGGGALHYMNTYHHRPACKDYDL